MPFSSPIATATFTFTGTDLQVIAAVAPQLGTMKLTLDGVASTVDLYSASPRAQQVVFGRQNLPYGPHTLVIRPTGQRNPRATGTTIDLDAIDAR